MSGIRVRPARKEDLVALARMRNRLWPDGSIEEHSAELTAILAGKPPGIMPLVIFVAEANGSELVGFIETGLRSYADGCDAAVPVGYVEGWYVNDDVRRQGIGAALVDAAEQWAQTQGCVEMASDADLENEISQRAHEALGYEVVEKSVKYRKNL